MFFKKIAAALFGLTFIIVIHELGHFTFCKLFSIDTPTFSVGFGPTLMSKKMGKTTFVLAAIPLGGYVEISGMDNTSYSFHGNYKNAFSSKPFYQQFLVIMGGILFNFLFSFSIYGWLWLTNKKTNNVPTIATEEENEPPVSPNQQFKNLLQSKGGGFIGPLGIFSLLSESINLGIRFYVILLAIISFNLGLINVLPLPILDGGQLVLYSFQALGAPINPGTKQIISAFSWIILFLFIVLISSLDVRRMFKKS